MTTDKLELFDGHALPGDLAFSAAVKVGDLLFLSGNLGNPPGEVEMVPGGIGAETRQAIGNMRRTLEAHGSGLDRVIKTTVFIVDIDEFADFNAAYVEAFAGHKPTRSTVVVKTLGLGARVEIECIALAG